jgi:hypothetical protein
MHIHHVRRGGLLALGVGTIIMSTITATVGAGSPGVPTAPAVGRAEVTVSAPAPTVPMAVRPAPAAIPVSIEVVVPPVEAADLAGNEPERPVVHAGPGPATPVEGATTLIDPLVIER